MKKIITVNGDGYTLELSLVYPSGTTHTKTMRLVDMTVDQVKQVTNDFLTMTPCGRGAMPGSDRCNDCKFNTECN